MTAVSQSGSVLQLASQELREDREIVLKAVSSSGLALEFASGDLREFDHALLRESFCESGEGVRLPREFLRGRT